MKQISIEQIRQDFPLLNQKINGKPLIYFDNAATTQKPQIMIDSLVKFYTQQNSNTHSQHSLAEDISHQIDQIRIQILNFIQADSSEYSIIFTKNATEAINLVASSFGSILEKNERIILTQAEHHANLLPWQRLSKNNNLNLDFIKITADGLWDLSNLDTLLQKPTKFVCLNWVSNVLGVINPINKILEIASKNNIYSLIDGTQAIPHLEIDFRKFKPDFFVFSGHKIFGPTGIGVLVAKTSILRQMPAYQVGGEMVKQATLFDSLYQDGYQKFEAGTLNLAEIVGLSTSLEYFKNLLGKFDIFEYEQQLKNRLLENLNRISGIKILANHNNQIPLVSFYHNRVNDYDLSVFLDLKGVAVRSGRHCAEPLHNHFELNSTTRASLCLYNTFKEIDNFSNYLEEAINKLKN